MTLLGVPRPGTYTYEWTGRRYVDGIVAETIGPVRCTTTMTVDGTRVTRLERSPTRMQTIIRDLFADGWWTVEPDPARPGAFARRRLLEPDPLPASGHWANELEKDGCVDRIVSRVAGEAMLSFVGREFRVMIFEHSHSWFGRVVGSGVNTCQVIPDLGVMGRDHMRGQSTTEELRGTIMDLEEELVLVGVPD